MLHDQNYRFWRAIAHYLSASIALALLTFVCFRLRLTLAPTACLYLLLIVLLSLQGSFLLSVVFSLIAVGCLAYYFAPPDFSFRVSDPLDVVAIIVFLTAAAVVTHLVSRVRKSAETLREQAALLDLTHDTIFVRDVDDVITYWNRGAEELYGWTRGEAVGKNSHDLNQTVFPAPLEDIKAELIRTGRWEGDLIHTRRDETKVVVASRWSLQRDDQGRAAGTLETNNDITERKRTEEALQESQAELAHVTRVTTLGELAASIAHEINEPLAAIVKDGERAAEVITRIRALLSRSSVAQQPCDLAGVIREVDPLVRPELGRHGITLEMSLATDVPAVMGDRIQLQQVLLNLLMNAAEAVREVPPQRRRLVVRSSLEDRDDGPWAVVAVEDAGVGFGEDEAARLFEAFYTTKPDGLGMGLSISRSIMDGHRGRLWATANPGHGATFHFALPALR